MRKKIILFTLLAACGALSFTGCRSRITASTDADEIRDAEDALAEAGEDTVTGKEIKDFLSSSVSDKTDTENEEDEQETKSEDHESSEDEIPKVTIAPTVSAQDPDVPEEEASAAPEDVPDPNRDKQDDHDAEREYFQDKKETGDDTVNTNSGNKTDKGDGKSSGDGGDGGNGGNNPGAGPGIGIDDPTIPPETIPLESEENPTTPDPDELPTEEHPESEEPEIFVNVNFDPGDGQLNGAGSVELKVGEIYGNLPEAYKNGFTFGGWFTQENGNGIRIGAGSIVELKEDHTLYAFYAQREIHNVHFVTEGVKGNYWIGNAADENRQVYVGETYGAPFPVPRTKSGYTFLGWYDAPEGGRQVSNTEIFTANTDVELYAHMNYDPLAFWTGFMNNMNDYPCQDVMMINELDETDAPVTNSVFIARLGKNAIQAADSGTAGMSTSEILKKKPNTRIMIKMVSDISNADSVAAEVRNRFRWGDADYKTLYIIPSDAMYGDASTTLVYNLAFKIEIWQRVFEDVTEVNPWGLEATAKAAEELGVPYPTILRYGI